MERYCIFNDKNTWTDWRMVLTSKDITPPEPKTNYVTLDGMSGSLDLSDALTGEITYQDRKITLSFWCCEGTRADRENLIREITAYLHGKKVKIIEPDSPNHYFFGRGKITARANNVAYAEISVEFTCEPWKYANDEITRTMWLNSDNITDMIVRNNGVRTLSPIISVTGDVEIVHNGETYTLTNGHYKIPSIKLVQGVNTLGVSGNGSVSISYREAEL